MRLTVRGRLLVVNAAIVLVLVAANTVDLPRYLDGLLGLRWSSELVQFIRAETRGLYLLVAISLIVEFVSGSRERDVDELLREYVSRSLHAERSDFLVELGVGAATGEPEAGREVAQRLALAKPPLRSCVVHVSVAASFEHADQLIVENQTEFDWDRDRAIYAFVRTSDDMSSVVTRLDEVTEVQIVKNPDRDFASIRAQYGVPSHSPILAIPNSGPSERLPLKVVSKREAASLARKAGVAPDSVLFLSAQTSSTGRLRVLNRQEHSVDINFTWWMSDRLLEIDMLRIDLSAVAKSAESVEIVPFWIAPGRDSNLVATGVWEFRRLGWITPGDGVVAHWQK